MSTRYIAAVCPHGLTTAGAVYDTKFQTREDVVEAYFERDHRQIEDRVDAPTIQACRACRDRDV